MHLNVSTILHIDFISIRESAVVKYLNIPVFLYLGLEWISAEAYSGGYGGSAPFFWTGINGFQSRRTKKFKPYPGKILDYAPGSQNYKNNLD